MTIEILANTIIDEMIAQMDEYENHRREHRKLYPHGQYITNDTPYMKVTTYINQEKAEKAMSTLRWALRDTPFDIYAAAHTARKWYKRTRWERCLPEETAERLLAYYSA